MLVAMALLLIVPVLAHLVTLSHAAPQHGDHIYLIVLFAD